MKFKAAVLYKHNEPLRIEDLEIPKLKNGQVLVKVLYTSICGSQINEICGHKGPDKYLPHLLGHEGYGEIVDIDTSVSKVFNIGDRVILTWINCNDIQCDPIKFREINAGPMTTFSEYTIVSVNKLVIVDQGKNNKYNYLKPLCGCAIPTGACTMRTYIDDPNKILIIGLGGVGLSAAIYAKRGYSIDCYTYRNTKIFGIDINSKRMDIAKKLGIEYPTILSSKDPLDVDQFNCIIDCSGSMATVEKFLPYLKKRGTLVLVGNPDIKDRLSINPYDIILKEHVVCGSTGGYCSASDISNFSRGNILKHYAPIVTKVMPFVQINEAIELMKTGKEIKVVLEL